MPFGQNVVGNERDLSSSQWFFELSGLVGWDAVWFGSCLATFRR